MAHFAQHDILRGEGRNKSGSDWRLAVLAQLNDLVENTLGDFPLRGLGNFEDFVAGDDRDGVAVGVEAYAFAGNVVDHNRVEVL